MRGPDMLVKISNTLIYLLHLLAVWRMQNSTWASNGCDLDLEEVVRALKLSVAEWPEFPPVLNHILWRLNFQNLFFAAYMYTISDLFNQNLCLDV